MISTEEELSEFVATLRPHVAGSSSGALEVFDILMWGGEPWEALTSLLEDPDVAQIGLPKEALNRIEAEVLAEFGTETERTRYRNIVASLRRSSAPAAA